VNDDTVLLARWSVPQFAEVRTGDVVCEVETSKATSEVTADRSGVLMQVSPVGARVRIREPIGAIGPTRESVVAYVSAPAPPPAGMNGGVRATPKARALAERHGVAIAELAGTVRGTIKEADVRGYIAKQGAVEQPHAPQPPPIEHLELEGP